MAHVCLPAHICLPAYGCDIGPNAPTPSGGFRLVIQEVLARQKSTNSQALHAHKDALGEDLEVLANGGGHIQTLFRECQGILGIQLVVRHN